MKTFIFIDCVLAATWIIVKITYKYKKTFRLPLNELINIKYVLKGAIWYLVPDYFIKLNI